MKVDFYTKAVLTVIASCLVYFVAKDVVLIQHAHAQSGAAVDVNIVKMKVCRCATHPQRCP